MIIASPERHVAFPGTPERLAQARTLIGDNFVTLAEPVNLDVDKAPHHETVRMFDHSPVEHLARVKAITGEEYQAAERFYADWYFGGLANSGTVDPAKPVVDGGGSPEPQHRKLAALQRFQRAVRAVGLIHSRILVDIVLMGTRLEDYGRSVHGYAGRKSAVASAVGALKPALQALDHHYHPKRRGMRTTHLTPDYRPSIHATDETDA